MTFYDTCEYSDMKCFKGEFLLEEFSFETLHVVIFTGIMKVNSYTHKQHKIKNTVFVIKII
jgi:hypothetical protein